MSKKKLRKQSFRLAPHLEPPTQNYVNQVVERLLRWGPVRQFPWREKSITPFQVLITEILLARTSAESVASVIEELWSRYPTPIEMSNASVKEIEDIIRPLGLRKRAGMLYATALSIVERGGITDGKFEVNHLPGVGKYVADAYRLFVFNVPVIPIDAVIGRVIRRLYNFPDFGPAYADRSLWTVAQIHASHDERRRLVAAILDLGALICLPKSPMCHICPVNNCCQFFQANISSQ